MQTVLGGVVEGHDLGAGVDARDLVQGLPALGVGGRGDDQEADVEALVQAPGHGHGVHVAGVAAVGEEIDDRAALELLQDRLEFLEALAERRRPAEAGGRLVLGQLGRRGVEGGAVEGAHGHGREVALVAGVDFTEVGTAGTVSNKIQFSNTIPNQARLIYKRVISNKFDEQTTGKRGITIQKDSLTQTTTWKVHNLKMVDFNMDSLHNMEEF